MTSLRYRCNRRSIKPSWNTVQYCDSNDFRGNLEQKRAGRAILAKGYCERELLRPRAAVAKVFSGQGLWRRGRLALGAEMTAPAGDPDGFNGAAAAAAGQAGTLINTEALLEVCCGQIELRLLPF